MSTKLPTIEQLTKPWTFWKNDKDKRGFVVVDITTTHIVMMEVRPYQPGEERTFIKLDAPDFVTLKEKGKLKEWLPMV